MALVFIFGSLVGSFLNVLVLRHGFKERRRPRSGCMHCGAPLSWFELVPLLSFLALRGRCRQCGSRISLRYLVVELITATTFAMVWHTLAPMFDLVSAGVFLLTLVFWAAFIGLLVYDIRHTLVPWPFVFVMAGSAGALRGVEAFVGASFAPLVSAFFGMLVVGGFLAVLSLGTRGRGMGIGDAYAGAALGILTGWFLGIQTLILSFWVGAIVGIMLIVLKKGFTIRDEVPFVPFLFIGAIGVLMFGMVPTETVALLSSFL